eukprot:3085584-Pleurochrysis_carterae.AAC.1
MLARARARARARVLVRARRFVHAWVPCMGGQGQSTCVRVEECVETCMQVSAPPDTNACGPFPHRCLLDDLLGRPVAQDLWVEVALQPDVRVPSSVEAPARLANVNRVVDGDHRDARRRELLDEAA